MRSVIQDLQYAARMFWRAPLFPAVAILTLSLGIGANSALFSVINTVLLRPLPFERAEELYVVSSTYQGVRREFTSFSDFADWRARSRAFTHVAAIRGDGVSVTTPSGPEFLTGAAVSEEFFALFGVQPFLGRTFVAAEHRPSQGGVAVLSHRLWLRRFGGNPAVVGTSVVLEGEPHTVIGVLPAGFAFPDDAELWRPLTLTASDANRRVDSVRVIARVRPDIAPAQAQAEVTGIARQLEQRYPNSNANWGVELVSLRAKSTEDVRRTLLALWGAVACVLLIACANLGIMLLSRGIRRAPELAVRAALGASRGRVVRQLLTESVLLAMLGGIGGILVATWGIFTLRAFAPAQTPRFHGVGLDLPVLIFTAAISLGTGLLVGIVPVWRIMRSDLHNALREGGGSASRSLRQHHLMRALAMGQVAVSLVLLIGVFSPFTCRSLRSITQRMHRRGRSFGSSSSAYEPCRVFVPPRQSTRSTSIGATPSSFQCSSRGVPPPIDRVLRTRTSGLWTRRSIACCRYRFFADGPSRRRTVRTDLYLS